MGSYLGYVPACRTDVVVRLHYGISYMGSGKALYKRETLLLLLRQGVKYFEKVQQTQTVL